MCTNAGIFRALNVEFNVLATTNYDPFLIHFKELVAFGVIALTSSRMPGKEYEIVNFDIDSFKQVHLCEQARK